MRRTVEIFKNFDRNTQTKKQKKIIDPLLFFGVDTEVSISSHFIIHPKKENQIHINQQCVESMLPFRILIFKVGSGQLISEISVPQKLTENLSFRVLRTILTLKMSNIV